MKKVIIISVALAIHAQSVAQTPHDFGSCFGKANRKSIERKMDKLLSQVSEETNCEKDKLTYQITEYYRTFYSKECRHLPKKIAFDIRGEKHIYLHNGLSGAVLYWLLGNWAPAKELQTVAAN